MTQKTEPKIKELTNEARTFINLKAKQVTTNQAIALFGVTVPYFLPILVVVMMFEENIVMLKDMASIMMSLDSILSVVDKRVSSE